MKLRRIASIWAAPLLVAAALMSAGPAAFAASSPARHVVPSAPSGHAAGHPAIGLPVGFSKGPAIPTSFSDRWDVAYDYDSVRNEVVLFGGAPAASGGAFSNQTWYFTSGKTWVQGPNAPALMGARGGSAMAFDPDIGKSVLFGGSGGQWPPLNDTWLFDGTSWTQGPAAPPGLAGRYGAEMVYDASTHKLVLFGGSGVAAYNDTWLFDGTKWTQGPTAPTAMVARTFFGMAYDPSTSKVMVAGGDGGLDTWLYDGTSWTAGPSMPTGLGAMERFNMDYDPDLGGIVMFGGIGPAYASQLMYQYKGGSWQQIKKGLGQSWPGKRIEPLVVFDAGIDALLVIGGINGTSNGLTMFHDAWYYVTSAISIAGVTIAPTSPKKNDTITSTLGATSGGIPPITYTYNWYKNGTLISGASGPNLAPNTAVHGDNVSVQVQATDLLGYKSGWVTSNTVTVINQAPTISQLFLAPSSIYTGDTVSVTIGSSSDPDGDPVTVHYAWTVNSVLVAGDQPTLPPSYYKGGDVVSVTCTPTDSLGLSGTPVATSGKTTLWRLILTGSHSPGGAMLVMGRSYTANEKVDIRADSPTGTLLGTATADGTGAFSNLSVPLPNPYPGGTHTIYGIGKTSGLQGTGQVTITPFGSLDTTSLGAGDSTDFTGTGFGSNENVSVSFPGGSVVNATADANGSLSVPLVSPAEPNPNGFVSAAAASGTAQAQYTTKAILTMPTSARPGDTLSFSLSGYGVQEPVTLTVDSVAAGTYTSDSTGSYGGTFTLNTLWGTHTATVTGSTSAVSKSATISASPWMTATPSSGQVGTSVTVDSGPGWTPNELVHLKWNGAVQQDFTADATGKVHATFLVPTTAIGPSTASLVGVTSGAVANATFTVTNSAGPQLSGVTLSPTAPTVKDQIVATPGTVTGGVAPFSYTYSWYVNGNLVSTGSSTKLAAGSATHNSTVSVSAQVTDSQGSKSDWVSSGNTTVVNSAPTVSQVYLSSSSIYTGDTVSVSVGNVSDPDGDAVTLHYAWTVNGLLVGGDQPTLAPTLYKGGDVVAVTCTPTDALGLSGTPVATSGKTTLWRLILTGSHNAGGAMLATGRSYAASEQVDIRADSVTGTLLGTATADATGSFSNVSVPLPTPYAGGTHTFYGVGRVSGLQGTGQSSIVPGGSLSVTGLAAGDPTTFSATGFLPNESVSVSFPGATPVATSADANGSLSVALSSPPEPSPNGYVTATAGSGVAQALYTTKAVYTVPTTAKPGDTVSFSATGYGASESVNLTIDAVQVATYTSDASGSVSGTFVINTKWGNHPTALTGATSLVSKSVTIATLAWMTLSPTSGPVNTVVSVDSGPGWTPNETVHLKWNGQVKVDFIADANGKVDGTFSVPSNASGVANVSLVGATSGATCTTTFTVTTFRMEVHR